MAKFWALRITYKRKHVLFLTCLPFYLSKTLEEILAVVLNDMDSYHFVLCLPICCCRRFKSRSTIGSDTSTTGAMSSSTLGRFITKYFLSSRFSYSDKHVVFRVAKIACVSQYLWLYLTERRVSVEPWSLFKIF